MWFDSHCHLDAVEFDPDRDAVVASACRSGVDRILLPAVDIPSFSRVRDCCLRYPVCVPAYGIHPLYTPAAGENDLEHLDSWLQQEPDGMPRAVAIGEIGLDFFVAGHDVQRQEWFFVEQLKLAKRLGLPVVLHVRRAIDQVLKHVRQSGVRQGIVHAFNGSRQQAEAFIALGFRLGFGGAMTYPRATRIRELATHLPIDAIVLETDAPDIPPAWLGASGHMAKPRNTPDQLPAIAAVLSELRGTPIEEIARITAENARTSLGLGR